MKQLTYLRVFVLSLIGLLGGAVLASDDRPNIIYILADDLGYGELGCYGQEKIETPNIDLLARQGMLFTQHYSGSAVCAPARCVLMTGKHTGHAHIRGNDEWGERGDTWNFAKAVDDPNLEGQRPLPEGTATIGRLLQSVGYRTAVIGKWGLGAPLTEGIPNNQGFDFFFGYNCQRQAHTLYPKHLWRNEEKVWLKNKLVVPGTKLPDEANPNDPDSYGDYELEDYAPTLMLEETLQFIDRSRNQPFFIYFATPIPHVPLQAPRHWVEHYQKKFGPEEHYSGDRGYFPNRSPRATYAAMVSYLDEQVGAIVERLKELGEYENTLIVFSSDNGPTYNGGSDSAFFDSGAPFNSERGWGKGYLHEGGIRVPMIAHWPGRIAAGTTSDHVSAFWDVLPTLCELADAEAPADTDGVSFLPELLGTGKQAEHQHLYWEFPSYGGQQAVRMGKWKAIRRDIFKGNMALELYDLEADPKELNDLASTYPGIVRKMETIMASEHQPAALERFKIKELGD
ncbi:arylsulfatase [Pelagicoccus mobilis]|uniref:Arylsulfatase n=1 Tax=Pelagicoccus mobilis TaxID=415221 RepID=A0A934VN42_9BACT|nr:arylsulfatase [Pelagicoccus mobilis]MBK1875842.1 arylsulfatase [Pelagicoccus mobilis]